MAFPFQFSNLASLRRVVRPTTAPFFHRPFTLNLDTDDTRPHQTIVCTSFHPLGVKTCSKRVEYEAIVREIARKMRGDGANRVKELEIIDILQRAGIDHLFRDEISEALHRHYTSTTHSHQPLDLYQASLRFRLLRDEGYQLSSTETFGEYTEAGGGGKLVRERVAGNGIQGLLGLFEASQMSCCSREIGGDDDKILDEAKSLSEQLLRASIHTLDPTSATLKLVSNTLKYPHHMTFPRFKANDFIRHLDHDGDYAHTQVAGLAAKEFQRARSAYKDEILQISKWWEELGLTEDLEHARDSPMEWHLWSVGALPDPGFAEERIQMSKAVSLIYVIDDIFDIYGTPHHLSLFTHSVQRWDIAAADKLPEYMKRCLKAVFDTTSHISHEIWLKHGFNPEHQLRKVWADLFSGYLVESKWFALGYLPTTQEYMNIGTITSGVHVVLVHMMFLLGQGTGADFENDRSHRVCRNHIHTRIISSVSAILRLWNDLGKTKMLEGVDQPQIGHDSSYIECYMKENVGVSEAETKEHIVSRFSEIWKDLNGMCLQLPHSYPHTSPYSSITFKQGCLNLARIVPLMYDYDNARKKPVVEDLMHSLLNDAST